MDVFKKKLEQKIQGKITPQIFGKRRVRDSKPVEQKSNKVYVHKRVWPAR